jgi:quercetin dioxygenase-like cupin family protein
LILALYERREGVETGPGKRVVYDVERGSAHFGEASVEGHALVWELDEPAGGDALLTAEVALDDGSEWLMRCDRVDFPPGGVAYRHTHPGPGIRCLLHGSIQIESGGETHTFGPFEPWFESGPEPVLATASADEETAFVRVMLLPAEWAGRRTIRYVDPADEEKPKLQRATVFFDEPIDL